jgi:hypothetical protein
MLSDTHPDAERVQIELLRKTAPEERLAQALSLTATVVNLSRQTIAELNPTLGPRDLELKCIEFYHGKALADRVRDYLRKRNDDVAV